MSVFRYVAKNQDGQTVSGTVESDARQLVIEDLRRRALVILDVSEERARRRTASEHLLAGGVNMDSLAVCSRQLSTMVDSGIPLVQCLEVIGSQTEHRVLRALLRRITQDVEAGSSFSEALQKRRGVFGELYVNMVRAGESSGALDEVLNRLAGYLEKTAALHRKIRSSMVYPVLVSVIAFLITAGLVFFVIPQFKDIFATLGGTLPLPTRVLIAVSDFARAHVVAGLIGAILLGVALLAYGRTDPGRLLRDRLMLRVPVMGMLLRKVAMARFARTLATLTRTGVPILLALEIVARTSGNKVVERAVIAARQSVREGESIAHPLAASRVFPPMVVQMVAVGEESGNLEKMLTKIAEFYEEQVDAAVTALTSLIEPLLISVLGVVVGGIVMAMFLPILKVTELVTTGH